MPLEFELLSMTEFRKQPGEILDRVADDEEAFIIERNGRRQACLVPLSEFFPNVSPSRIADEIEELNVHNVEPRTTITKVRELAFRFPHNWADKRPIELMIVLPHGYPSSCPRVYASSIRKDAPHRWNDGALCLFGVMTAWNPGKQTVFTTMKLAQQWLRHYDIWCKLGQWPKQEVTANE